MPLFIREHGTARAQAFLAANAAEVRWNSPWTIVARQLQISPIELATAAVRDLVAPHSSDFLHAAERVLARNHDLYRRLA